MSIKKHVRQMSNAEINYLIGKVRSAKEISTTDYSFERIKQRGGSLADIKHVLLTGYIVEYHKRDADSHRVLVRGTKRYGNDVMCAVLDMRTNLIITVYYNRHDDHHSTLNDAAYNKHINILKEMEAV
jgi:hypothetical protein